ncbi:MAG TPA: response regulator transcription factor [Spirochaetota bacterium]|nr:response regulator transcription factor [Spirochaetota bacterium]HPC40315.1 response regulator transcription factor [Spirochaetota bacterium]HPL18258.1 response regulator transcription factor [Spirochaetota bacterium]HQF07211.1 response regulator transcription factor [Spirochaetota bacterium]HQH96111.1 response regulator transcription factor [Spirochaetota bacterium]
MQKKIFVIDDEKDIQDIIKINLRAEGYDVYCYSSAEEALRALETDVPHLFILDIMMPGIDGFEFCRRVRASEHYKSIPIIFLSARSDEIDRVLGLELGGDDYMTKPFSVKELKSRVKAMFRRLSRMENGEHISKTIVHEGIELDPDHYSLCVDGKGVDLTKTEFEILRLLLANPGKVFTRDNIIDSIKGQDVYVIDRTIDVHVMNIRKKLGPYKNVIKTFSGVGYGFKK